MCRNCSPSAAPQPLTAAAARSQEVSNCDRLLGLQVLHQHAALTDDNTLVFKTERHESAAEPKIISAGETCLLHLGVLCLL